VWCALPIRRLIALVLYLHMFPKMRFLYQCVLQSVFFHAMPSALRFCSHSAKFCTAPYPGVSGKLILANQMAAYMTRDYVSVETCFDVSPPCLMDLYSNFILSNKNVATSHRTFVFPFEAFPFISLSLSLSRLALFTDSLQVICSFSP